MNSFKKSILACAVTGALVSGGGAVSEARMSLPGQTALPSFARPVLFDSLFGGGQKQQQAQKKTYRISDDKAFEENTRTVHMRPYNNPNLEYDITVPKDWSLEDKTEGQQLNTDQDIMNDVATFESEMIGVFRLNGSVSVQPLKYEISARNWLKSYIFKNGYALQGEMTESGPRRASAYFTSIKDASNYYTYISAQVTGGVVLISRFDVPLPLKDLVTYIQKKLVDSIQISYPRDDSVEPQKNFTLVDAIKFSYPISWDTRNPDFKDMSRLSVLLETKNAADAVEGFIRILAVRRSPDTNLAAEIEEQKKHFSDFMGINIKSMTSSVKPNLSTDRFIFSRYETYAASYAKEGSLDPEIHFVVLGSKDWYIFIYLITPREQENLNAWGRNVRTLELLLESIR